LVKILTTSKYGENQLISKDWFRAKCKIIVEDIGQGGDLIY